MNKTKTKRPKGIKYTKAGIKWFNSSSITQGTRRIIIQEQGLALAAIAKRLKINCHLLGQLVEGIKPKYRVGLKQRKFYGIGQLPEIRKRVETYQRPMEQAKAGITLKRLADYLQCHHTILQYHCDMGHCPTPKRGWHNYQLFTEAQCKKVFAYFNKKNHLKATLFNLHRGLRELGATKADISYQHCHKIFPNADPVILNPGKKGRFYTLNQCKQCLKAIRKARGEKF